MSRMLNEDLEQKRASKTALYTALTSVELRTSAGLGKIWGSL